MQLLRYNEVGPDRPLYRKYEIENDYKREKAKLMNESLTPGILILNKIFADDERKYIITRNKFPYDLEKNIIHYVVWENPLWDITLSDIIADLNAFSIEYVIFPYDYRGSIPNLIHYQLFIQGDNKKKD